MSTQLSRRNALGILGLAAAAAGFGVPRSAVAETSRPTKTTPNAGTYRFSVGNFQLTVLSDGYGNFPTTQPTWVPEATAEDLKPALESALLPTDQLTLSFNPILITNRQSRTRLLAGKRLQAFPATTATFVSNR